MSATTAPKRETSHHSGGGVHRRRPYILIAIGAVVFVAAWLIWTFAFSNALLPG